MEAGGQPDTALVPARGEFVQEPSKAMSDRPTTTTWPTIKKIKKSPSNLPEILIDPAKPNNLVTVPDLCRVPHPHPHFGV